METRVPPIDAREEAAAGRGPAPRAGRAPAVTAGEDAYLTPGEPPPLTVASWVAGTLTRWRIVRRGALAGVAIATAALVVLDPVYRSEATFATEGSSGLKLSGGSSAGALAAIASQFGVSGSGAEPSDSPEFYAKLIQGRELLTRLLWSRVPDPRTDAARDSVTVLDLFVDSVSLGERLGIRKRDADRRLEKGVRLLRSDIVATNLDTRTGIVGVVVETRWPDVSQSMANRVVALVGDYNVQRRQTRAKARRVFSEERLDDAQSDLSRAETRLREFYESNRRWETAPLLVFEEGRLRRQVEIATDMYLTMRREFETARIAEVNDSPVLSVLDSAVAPRHRARPQPVPMLAGMAIVGALVGLLIAAIATAAADWGRRDPASAGELRTAWRRALVESLPWRARRRRAVAGLPSGR